MRIVNNKDLTPCFTTQNGGRPVKSFDKLRMMFDKLRMGL